jgi:hypothetical protein
MRDQADRQRLAQETLRFAHQLATPEKSL